MSLESHGKRIRSGIAGLAWIAVAIAIGPVEAQESRRAANFAGGLIPEPPSQGRPWTPPATTLPRFLEDATGTLFDQGVADPRGCEYREVEVASGGIVKARGFVLPERPDAPGRFVVCWDGLVYPAPTVGAPADLDRNILDMAADLKRLRESDQLRGYRGRGWAFPVQGKEFRSVVGVDDRSPLKLCLLLRLGRADLAEALFAAGTTWTPGPRPRDLTDYGISYLSLAGAWANSAFVRLADAHGRGDDAIALDAARRLSKFRDLATAKADAMGFPGAVRQEFSNGPFPPFQFLAQLDDLLRDQERRASMPARGPIPPTGGDPTARVAALIRDLDQVDGRQMSSMVGGVFPASAPPVQDLIAEGDAAVGPLLAVLESDDRLTRSVAGDSRGMADRRSVQPVHQVAFAALVAILKTSEFRDRSPANRDQGTRDARKALAASIRRTWERTRSIAPAERWYRALLDDSAGSDRWLEAAGWIAGPDTAEGMPAPPPGTRPVRGEPLRGRRGPSVADLMLRRAGQVERGGDPQASYDPAFQAACRMGFLLAAWDETASLPLLRHLGRECRERSDRWRDPANGQMVDRNLAADFARFAEIRARLGDADALDEYAAWLRATGPRILGSGTFAALRPLLARPDHPALASAARWMFHDPRSPWIPLLPEARGEPPGSLAYLDAPPLIVLPTFRDRVLDELADRTPFGTIERGADGSIRRQIKDRPAVIDGTSNLDLEGLAVGLEYPFRYCDALAASLSRLQGGPRSEMFWPEARRDEAVAASAAYLRRFGGSFTIDPPPGASETSEPAARLRFPALDKPASRDDVATARAIFSLEGEGEVRRVSLPGYPRKARWVTLRDVPVDWRDQAGATTRKYDTDGVIWQAEEVRKGDRWERSYGFVGHHVIARAPASEVEFAEEYGPWLYLEGGLDARIEPVAPTPASIPPGRPIPLALHIRNRLGVAHAAPTDLVRPSPDGKPALRKGLDLLLWHSPERGPRYGMNQVYPNDPVKPSREARFDPGPAFRPLEPLEAFEALRLDPRDWFDLSRPGRYRLRLTFAADSDLGQGTTRDLYFDVGPEG